jgi:hypothetical protein
MTTQKPTINYRQKTLLGLLGAFGGPLPSIDFQKYLKQLKGGFDEKLQLFCTDELAVGRHNLWIFGFAREAFTSDSQLPLTEPCTFFFYEPKIQRWN